MTEEKLNEANKIIERIKYYSDHLEMWENGIKIVNCRVVTKGEPSAESPIYADVNVFDGIIPFEIIKEKCIAFYTKQICDLKLAFDNL